MASLTLPYPTFNWKCSYQLRVFDQFHAQRELWLAGEQVDPTLQYTKIVLMLGDDGLSHWSKLKLSSEDKWESDRVFQAFENSLCTNISHQNACPVLYNSFHQ